MESTEFILWFYVLPMVVTLFLGYIDKHTETIGDFLGHWWIYLIPTVNIFFASAGVFIGIVYFFTKSDFTEGIRERWRDFLNAPLKR
mgnify:CR=1 FL=1